MKDKQIEIIKEALYLIADKGLEHLTMRNLAARMGFKDPALYYHFKNKEMLLKMIVEYGFFVRSGEMRDDLEIQFGKPKSPLEMLDRIVMITTNLFIEYPGLAVIEFGFLGYDLENSPKQILLKSIQLGKSEISSILEKAREQELIRSDIDILIIYDFFQSLFFMPLYQWTLNRFQDDIKQIIWDKFLGFKQLIFTK